MIPGRSLGAISGCAAPSPQRSALTGTLLLLRRAIEDHSDLFQRDQAPFDHLIEARQQLFDAFGVLDYFDDDWEILGQSEDFVGVIDAGAAITGYTAQHGRAGKALLAQHLDDGFVQRLAMPLVGFSDVDAHQSALAFKLFVSHMWLLKTAPKLGFQSRL